MRDDLKNLLEELIHLYQNKISLLEKILLSETDKKYALKSKNTDLLLKILEKNEEQINEIDSMDYEITSVKENVCSTIGIELSDYDKFVKDSEESLFIETTRLQNTIEETIKKLIIERDEIVEAIEVESMSIEKDMDSLQRIYKLSSK